MYAVRNRYSVLGWVLACALLTGLCPVRAAQMNLHNTKSSPEQFYCFSGASISGPWTGGASPNSVGLGAGATQYGINFWAAYYRVTWSNGETTGQVVQGGTIEAPPAPPTKTYKWKIRNETGIRQHYVAYDGAVKMADVWLEPGEEATGTYQRADGQESTIDWSTEDWIDGINVGREITDSNIGKWSTSSPPESPTGHTETYQPPSIDGTNINSTGAITFMVNTSDLAKEATLQTVGQTMHKDITEQGLATRQTLEGMKGKLGSIDASASSAAASASSMNSKLSTMDSRLSQLVTAANSIDTRAGQIKDEATAIKGKMDGLGQGMSNIVNGVEGFRSDFQNFTNRQHGDLEGIRTNMDLSGLSNRIPGQATSPNAAAENGWTESTISSSYGSGNKVSGVHAVEQSQSLPEAFTIPLGRSGATMFSIDFDPRHNDDLVIARNFWYNGIQFLLVLTLTWFVYGKVRTVMDNLSGMPQATSASSIPVVSSGTALLTATIIVTAIFVAPTVIFAMVNMSDWSNTLSLDPFANIGGPIGYGIMYAMWGFPIVTAMTAVSTMLVVEFQSWIVQATGMVVIKYAVG